MSVLTLQEHVREYGRSLGALVAALDLDRLAAIGDVLLAMRAAGGRCFVIGNGGSAATAAHIACDLTRVADRGSRPCFGAFSLADNAAQVTRIANDVAYDEVFAAQVDALGASGDVVLAVSASGGSPNILRGLVRARERRMTTIGLLGFDGGEARLLADHVLLVPSFDYGLVEDVHLIAAHALTSYLARAVHEEEH